MASSPLQPPCLLDTNEMKTKNYVTLVMALLLPCVAISQSDEEYRGALRMAVTEAIMAADIEDPTPWIAAFEPKYKEAQLTDVAFIELDQSQRIKILADYISAKSDLQKISNTNSVSVTDFTWNYLDAGISFKPMLFDGLEAASLVSTTVNGQTYTFANSNENELKTGLVMPFANIPGSSSMEAQFMQSGKDTYWTGFANWDEEIAGAVILKQTVFADVGVQVAVSSSPAGAEIFVNGKKYYKNTNVTFAQPAGDVHIRLKLDGYSEWVNSRVLVEGESWNIDSILTPE